MKDFREVIQTSHQKNLDRLARIYGLNTKEYKERALVLDTLRVKFLQSTLEYVAKYTKTIER